MSEERQVEEPVREPGANEPVNKRTQLIQEVFAGSIRSGPAHHPIFDKFESQHVTLFLDHSFEKEKTEQQIRRSNRWFRFFYTALGIGIFVFLTLLLMPE